MKACEKLIQVAKQEEGYLEKTSSKDLDSKTANAGKNNYTKYARDLYPELQGQPWCDMFVDWCFVKTFGEVKARQLLCGGFSAYTPTSAQYYKNKGRWSIVPEPGSQIFFKNSVRINHTGIVMEVSSDRVYTIEGNTSSGDQVIANGGAVCKKSYPLNYARIAGYGAPDWSLVELPNYELGWHHDDYGWWYADTPNTYLKDCWKVVNGHKYYFNDKGYSASGWWKINGKWYYFEPRQGHPYECALYVSDKDGVQDIGDF
jgi:glucan-binding YG repeat protein